MRNSLRLLVLALVAGPALAPADKKDDELLEISRDVGSLSEQVRNLQKAQADQSEAMKQFIQQSAASTAQVAQEMTALQKSLAATLSNSIADQQHSISASVSPLATQMDALSKSMDALSATIAQMNRRFDSLDRQLKDISDKVSTINQPLPAPPPAPGAGPDASASGIPPGITNTGLWEDARRDYERGYYDTAQTELANFIRYFPNDTYAPSAGYDLAMISLHGNDFDGAAEAFQKVIDTYPGDNKAQDALYQKGVALEKGGHKAEALTTYREFVAKYPANDYASPAKQAIARLSGAKGGRGRGASTK